MNRDGDGANKLSDGLGGEINFWNTAVDDTGNGFFAEWNKDYLSRGEFNF